MGRMVFGAARLRTAVVPLVAILLVSTAGLPGRAAETARPATFAALATPARPTPGFPVPALPAIAVVAGRDLAEQPIALPALPPSDVRVLVPDDATGSIATPAAGEAARAVPPALTFEDAAVDAATPPRLASRLPVAPADRVAALLPSAPPTLGAATATSAPATPAPSPAAPAASSPAASSPAAPAPAPAPLPEPPRAVEAAPATPQGLDPTTLAAALQAFAAEKMSGETAAQATERRKSREAIAVFYAAHGDAPLWIADGRLTSAARSVLARLDHAAEDGLDLRSFAVPVPRAGDTASLAAGELALSEAAVAYARQASGSRVDIARLGGIIDLRPAIAEADRILSSVPSAADAGEALHAFNPPQPGYAALRQKLAELRQSSAPDAQNRIPAGPILKPGMRDARVPLIRARFGLDVASVEPGVPPLVYDTRVAAAVADFQRANGLPASGQLTPGTVAALSGDNPVALENTIIANMEMWRWQPRDTAPDRVEVNIPEYSARVFRDGAMIHETRVVVGQPDKQTPVFAEQMRFIIVNPYWNVPLSIIRKEMLPKLASDPNYFANHGYEVVERDGVRYVRQPPGDGNALGRIKFMFPNAHSVYLHDTNARSFFAREKRALSHGCVRVEQPFSFAEAVLGRENGWPEARIRKLIGGQERTINLSKPLPILITYFTAAADPQKGFQLRDDVYGYAGKVKTALALQD